MDTKQLKWIYLLILSLIWGSSFILIKRGLVGLTAIQVGSFRIIFAALFLLIIGFNSLKKISRRQWKFVAVTSLFGTFMPAYLFAIAETKVDSSIVAILNSLTPLNTLVLGIIAFGIQFQKRQVLGVFVGLVGCLLLVLTGDSAHSGQNYVCVLLVVIATLSYAINVNLIKKYLHDLNSISITTGNFAVLFLPALIILSTTDISQKIHLAETQHSIFFIMILGVLGTGIANILFFKLIQMSSPVFATSVTYLIPIVAFFWGLLDNEMLTPIQFFGAFIILIGVYLSAKK
ncbi:DMT family transporter [Flavobacterium sp. SORGH_AS_0622]|uniref:DMT family transporter n=1 Tax=Flavobacterium sp. SORGH_AS_0622 TaxID=3041772 RepID=UPI0027853D63|nr:DMT family transporter [Flavobacterium sp. SORGH_AS_0622]MDQ1164083.1 drug/metabolite transporter (DMT)-like permease [Flavobacterium sp. SORGH_AS_0622]